MCNGRADECSPTDNGLMACHCLHNTCGEQCQYCCDGYARDDSEDCFGRLLKIFSLLSSYLVNNQCFGGSHFAMPRR